MPALTMMDIIMSCNQQYLGNILVQLLRTWRNGSEWEWIACNLIIHYEVRDKPCPAWLESEYVVGSNPLLIKPSCPN